MASPQLPLALLFAPLGGITCPWRLLRAWTALLGAASVSSRRHAWWARTAKTGPWRSSRPRSLTLRCALAGLISVQSLQDRHARRQLPPGVLQPRPLSVLAPGREHWANCVNNPRPWPLPHARRGVVQLLGTPIWSPSCPYPSHAAVPGRLEERALAPQFSLVMRRTHTQWCSPAVLPGLDHFYGIRGAPRCLISVARAMAARARLRRNVWGHSPLADAREAAWQCCHDWSRAPLPQSLETSQLALLRKMQRLITTTAN